MFSGCGEGLGLALTGLLWVPEIELRFSGLGSDHLYLLSHLIGSRIDLMISLIQVHLHIPSVGWSMEHRLGRFVQTLGLERWLTPRR